jgi:dihydrofolate reductase
VGGQTWPAGIQSTNESSHPSGETPKVVFSTTLDRVDGNARLARSDPADEVEALKAEFDGDLSVGRAGLASSLTKLGLIDEYWLLVCPVVLGGGTPYFEGATPLDLELLDTRPLGQGVIYLRYRRLR